MTKKRNPDERQQPAILDQDPFLRAVLANPDDVGLRLVYADWLEERGDPRGEFLRLEAALMQLPREDERWEGMAARLRELRATLDRDWLTALGREPIEMCELPLSFQCPKQWERLQLTQDVSVRFCEACRQNVHYCHTIREAKRHAWMGHCVAVDPGVPRKPGDLINGTHMLLGRFDWGALELPPDSLETVRRPRRR